MNAAAPTQPAPATQPGDRELAQRVRELERRLDGLAQWPNPEGGGATAAGSALPPASKRATRASHVLRLAPRSHFENTALVTFNDREIVSVRKHFNGDESRPLTRTPYVRITPRVQQLLEFLYRFKGANYGCIAKRGIWSNAGQQRGLDAVCTNMLRLHAAGLIERNPYTHKRIIPDRELLAPAGRPAPDRPWVHVSLTTRAIRMLKADGTIQTGTNPSTLRQRLLSGRDAAVWSHQNNALDAALDLVNLAGGVDASGTTVSYELDKSDRELRHEQTAFLAGGRKPDFAAYKGRLTTPDLTLVKTITRPDGTSQRALILLEFDQGNYARAGILETKLDLLGGPHGHAATTDPADTENEREASAAYWSGESELIFANDSAPAFTQPTRQKAERFWAAKAKEYDSVKLVFVSYNDTVRKAQERRLKADYKPTPTDIADRPEYARRTSRQRDYINRHCEFVTLAELSLGRRVG